MSIFVKRLAAFAVTLVLLACLGVTALAQQSTDSGEDSLPEPSRGAEVSAILEESAALDDTDDTENPRTGVPAVLPVILLGLAGGSTALLTAKKR